MSKRRMIDYSLEEALDDMIIKDKEITKEDLEKARQALDNAEEEKDADSKSQ